MNEEIIDLTIMLQYQMEQMTDAELAQFMHGKLLRYDNKLYQYQGVKDVTINGEHEAKQE